MLEKETQKETMYLSLYILFVEWKWEWNEKKKFILFRLGIHHSEIK